MLNLKFKAWIAHLLLAVLSSEANNPNMVDPDDGNNIYTKLSKNISMISKLCTSTV